jgi:bifunctional DNA-binding transcriptional regulator/antitoxin component of YhaV-PrlF toxin-antitoxin module
VRYALLMVQNVKRVRRRGYTRVSSKHQVTIPAGALTNAGLAVGDRLRVEVRRSGEVTLVREDDPIETFAGSLNGVYGAEYLDRLRDEWG